MNKPVVSAVITLVLISGYGAGAQAQQTSPAAEPASSPKSTAPFSPHDLNGLWMTASGLNSGTQIVDPNSHPPFTAWGQARFDASFPSLGPRDVPGKENDPILAHWQYGLGKSVAFTSDARTIPGAKSYWDRDWANAPLYAKFWDQTVNWVLRPTESSENLFLTTEHKDGKIRIIIHARDADKTPLTDVDLKAGVTSPAFKVKDDRKSPLKFEQKNAGV